MKISLQLKHKDLQQYNILTSNILKHHIPSNTIHNLHVLWTNDHIYKVTCQDNIYLNDKYDTFSKHSGQGDSSNSLRTLTEMLLYNVCIRDIKFVFSFLEVYIYIYIYISRNETFIAVAGNFFAGKCLYFRMKFLYIGVHREFYP